MRKLIITALSVLVILAVLVMPCYASEDATEATETVAPIETEATEENATEGNVEATETAPVDFEDSMTAEEAREWLINAIKNAKPEEVEFVKGYIEDALVSMEGLNYTDWDWIYKIIADNVEWVACLVVGLGFIFASVVAIVKYKREKLLINNAVDAVGISEAEMGKMVAKMDGYEQTLKDTLGKVDEALVYMQSRDEHLAEKKQELINRDETVIAAAKNDVDAMLLLAEVLGDLIQLSAIPQIRKDEIYSKQETAKSHILKQMMGGESNEKTDT